MHFRNYFYWLVEAHINTYTYTHWEFTSKDDPPCFLDLLETFFYWKGDFLSLSFQKSRMEDYHSILPPPHSLHFWVILDRITSLVSFTWTILPFPHWWPSLSFLVNKSSMNLILYLISGNWWSILFEVSFLPLYFCFWGCFDWNSEALLELTVQNCFLPAKDIDTSLPVNNEDGEGLLDFPKTAKKVFPL